jgi:hypothetical protein
MPTQTRPRIEYRLPTLHAGQREVWDHPARFQVLCCGRRWGKTRLGALRCLVDGLEGRRAWWVAPSYKVAAVGWRELKNLANQVPGAESKEQDRLIRLPGGGTVQVRSADDPNSLRGEGLDRVIIDECAYVTQDAWTHSLRPALADRKGAAWFVSTPHGRNWFYNLWQRGRGEDDQWQAWRFPSVANPYLDPEEIRAAAESLPRHIAAQELEADFIESGVSLFSSEDIQACWNPLPAGGYAAKRRYLMSADVAGPGDDATVVQVWDVTMKPYRLMAQERWVTAAYERFYTSAERLNAVWKPDEVHVDATGLGNPMVEELQGRLSGVRVYPFTFTSKSKAEALTALQLIVQKHELAFGNEDLRRELEVYQEDDRNLMTDCVMAAAIMAYAVRGKRRLEWT